MIRYMNLKHLATMILNDPQYAMLDTRIDNVKEFRINVLSPVTFVGVAEFNLYEKK